MSKYSVGVGDAFPVDGADKRPDPEIRDDERDEDERRRYRRYRRYAWGRTSFLFEAALILFAIWAVMAFASHGHGPHGLLVVAGIVFAVGVVRRLFWRSHWARREWRLERRRHWGSY